MVTPTVFPVDKKTLADKKVFFTNVLIPWYPVSYLTIASSGFFLGTYYGSLPDAAIWWCLRTGGGGVLTRRYEILLYREKVLLRLKWIWREALPSTLGTESP